MFVYIRKEVCSYHTKKQYVDSFWALFFLVKRGPGGADLLPELEYPVSALRGVGARRETLLQEVGVETVADLLLFLPYRYVDRTCEDGIADLPADREVTAVGWVVSRGMAPGRRRRFVAVLKDGSGQLECVWFAGFDYLPRMFAVGDLVALGGKVSRFGRKLQMVHPEVEVLSGEGDERLHTGRIIPLYRTTARMKEERLGSRALRRLLHGALEAVSGELIDPIPEALRVRCDLPPLPQAIQRIHFPEAMTQVQAARRRLAFDELFALQLYAERMRRTLAARPGRALRTPGPLAEALMARLPFRLTGAQQRTIEEIWGDLSRPAAMRRLLQGDVGSGKTLVAALAMLAAVGAGAQAAFLAPTEILAKQHAATLQDLLAPLGLSIHLLTGRQRQRDRQAALDALASGACQIAVGTHALLQEGVAFADLGLAVVDEQHRFGVLQRALLREKGNNPHLLVMTATPIPRSLALTLYGDLDVTVLDELPPGRLPVKTGWRGAADRDKAMHFLRSQVEGGRQAYIVYPLIETSEDGDLKAASQAFEDLQSGLLRGLRLGLLHGRMSLEQKERTMAAFRSGDIGVLVSTTVIEVGVDVPNATVMLVEHAERFGLSQLHQLRGRVGRGGRASYCVLVADPAEGLTPEARARLDAMARTTDGFEIAEMDLKIRGPGQLFGTRQAGFPEFRFADLGRDGDLVRLARREAQCMLNADPDLADPGHQALRRRVEAVDLGRMQVVEAG